MFVMGILLVHRLTWLQPETLMNTSVTIQYLQLTLEIGCSLCSKPHDMNRGVMFRSSYLLAHLWRHFFRIFATTNIVLFVSILHQIHSKQRILPYKEPIPLLNLVSCSQRMQRTWWPLANTTIVTGSYSLNQKVVILPTFSSLAAPEVVSRTTSGATNDEKVVNVTTFSFKCSWRQTLDCPAANK